MEKMINLRDLLVHEVQDLYSAEEQIIVALPKMIEKANNNQLKKALQDHLKVTEKQKERLDEVNKLLGQESGEEQGKKGLFGLFGGGAHKCKGTEGIVKEGENIMGHDMTPEVMDAAIIASAQKIEHYEICGYGTARAYARELNLGDVAELLEETLNEEYEADDLLTDLAVGRLNEEAQNAQDDEGEGRGRNSRGARSKSSGGSEAGRGRSSNGKPSSNRSNGTSKSASARSNGSGSGSKSASKSSSKGASKSSSKSGSKSASKSASKGSSSSSKSGKSGGSKSSSSKGKSAAGKSRSSRAGSR